MQESISSILIVDDEEGARQRLERVATRVLPGVLCAHAGSLAQARGWTVEGIELMRERRHRQPDHNLTNGPGKLCIALDIDRRIDGADLLGDRVWIEGAERIAGKRIISGPRVGIDYAEEWVDKPWRFWIRDNSFVSRR